MTASTINRGSDVIHLEGCGEITDAFADCPSQGKREGGKSQKGKSKEEGMFHIFGVCDILHLSQISFFSPHSLTHCNQCA